MKILLYQFPIRSILEKARSPSHRCFDDFVAHNNEHIPGHGRVEAALALEVRGLIRLGKITRTDLGPSDNTAFCFQDFG